MGKVQFLLPALLLASLFAGCTPGSAPAPAPAPPPLATATAVPAPVSPAVVIPASPTKPEWQVEWEKTLAAALREGGLVLYTDLGGQQRQIITNAFTKSYGVHTEAVTGTSSLTGPKVLAEQRAGIYSVDIWLNGSTTYRNIPDALERLDPMLILPELTAPEQIKKTWYFGELPWANEAHTMLIGLMKNSLPVSTNTNLVKEGEIKSYKDILDPKWKGKISLQDPRISGMGNMWFAVVLELGDLDVNYVRELVAKQDVFITRDLRLQVDWLARGKHSIAIAPDSATVTEFISLGTPVNRINPGTPFVSGGSGSGMGEAKRAPHPNAAKLFINWLLSQEGQTFHSQATGVQSQRLDVSTTHLEPSMVLKPGLKAYRSDNEDLAGKRVTVYTPLAKEVFGP